MLINIDELISQQIIGFINETKMQIYENNENI